VIRSFAMFLSVTMFSCTAAIALSAEDNQPRPVRAKTSQSGKNQKPQPEKKKKRQPKQAKEPQIGLEQANLSPQEAVKAMTLPAGFQAHLFAGEPDVQQPNAFCIDDRGRLWVGENYTYTKVGWKPDDRDRILILEDTDGDGRFDKRKVFFDDFHYVSGIEVGFGGVWVGSPPNLLFIPDRDGDDVPDGEPQVVLDGWGRQDQHETLNTFMWGPDGWLYGCHGVFTHSRVGKPGTPDDQRQPINAGVWRYHPVQDEFEVFAWGTSNPWGIDWDEHGQMLMTACVIPHLWHVIQGGRYRRQSGNHFNPHVYEDIKNIARHTHVGFAGRKGGHAHGGALLYQGTSFPPQYRGKLMMCSIHHHLVYIDQLQRRGSGLVGDHFGELMNSHDPWFLGFNMQLGHDGAVYVIDWYDERPCHGQTPIGQNTGRIYKITYGPSRAPAIDMAQAGSVELARLAADENEWKVRHARRLLAERAASGEDLTKPRQLLLQTLHKDNRVPVKLKALWALHCIGAAESELLSELLSHENEYLRAWAVQLEAEDRQVPSPVMQRYAEMAVKDPSPVVRLYLASALQRMPLDARWPIAEGLVSHAEDSEDHNLPKMIWYGIEPLVPADKARALKLAAQSKIPKIRQFIARRATAK